MDSPIETYRLLTVTYGTACAPFLANACMLQLAEDEQTMICLQEEILWKKRLRCESSSLIFCSLQV